MVGTTQEGSNGNYEHSARRQQVQKSLHRFPLGRSSCFKAEVGKMEIVDAVIVKSDFIITERK
jgi:hypothetical protein